MPRVWYTAVWLWLVFSIFVFFSFPYVIERIIYQWINFDFQEVIQRMVAQRSARNAMLCAIIGGLFSMTLAVPLILVGAIASSTGKSYEQDFAAWKQPF